ncbi:predicted protein [Chaetoceros tenuissimus]|uniref:Uncharacterized protein n=1 Tax=Chaetoceros tenuissimus TaxID=426638 RepID=A0AAD3H5B3_9STRA|nr:predicted protein [Chaetoceros tenuissimus]
MPTTPLRSLASARARFRELAASNGEFTTPLRPGSELGGRDLEIHSVAPAIKVGTEVAYVRDPSGVCLTYIGSGSSLCLNAHECPIASHKAGNKFEAGTNPFFMELHQGVSAKGYRRGYTMSCLLLSGEPDNTLVESLLKEEGVEWKSRFEFLQTVPEEELTCSVISHLDMLQRTAIKNRPVLKERDPDDVDSPSMAQLLVKEMDRVSSITKQMLAACAEGSSSTLPDGLKDLVASDKSMKAVSDEIFMQLYKLLDLVGSLSSVVAVLQEDSADAESLKELVDGLSLVMRGIKTSIGQRPATSTLEPDVWSALAELEGKIDAEHNNLSQKIENVDAKTAAFVKVLEADEDEDSEMSGCGHTTHKSHSSCEHECCPSCTKNFQYIRELVDDLKRDNTSLKRKLEELDKEDVTSDQVGTFSIQKSVITGRHDVAALLLQWFPDASDLEPAFFVTPHLLWNLVWSKVLNNPNGMKIPFSDSDLMRAKINKRSAEAFYSTQSYLPQFMTADALPSSFSAKSSKSDRASSQAFKSIPTALDFGRSGDADYLHGKFRKALKDVTSQYNNYLSQKLLNHPIKECYLAAKQCLDDAVDHISHVLEFMEDQNYRNVSSFGEEKKTLAWNLVCACVKDVYEVHFKGCIDLVVATDLSDLNEVSVDVTYGAFAVNQLVKELNRMGLKHHPSVNTSQLRFMMESYAESSDDSAKIKKLEKALDTLTKAHEKQEEDMATLKRKHDNLNSVVSNMKKNKRSKRNGGEDDEE